MNYKKLKKLFPKRLYHYIDTLHSFRPEPFSVLRAKYDVRLLSEDAQIVTAKRFHADIYKKYGYISDDDTQDGVMHKKSDPYQSHADYFGVIDRDTDEVVAVARQIYRPDRQTQLPVFTHMQLKKTYTHLHHSQTVEISAFAKKKGVDSRALLLLFQAMLEHSQKGRHRYWLIACDKNVYLRLKALFGPVIRKVGPTTFYMGSDVVPAEIDIERAPKHLRYSYQVSLPPLRHLRKFLYSSFAEQQAGKTLRRTPKALFWDAYSNTYDGLMYFYPYRHLIEHVADRVLEGGVEPDQILDLGCGTGNVSVEILSRTTTTNVDAVDWSAQMLKHLERKIRDERLRVFESDLLLYLQRTRKKYDVIVMNNVFYTIYDKPRLWRLLQGRLKDGGRIVIANPRTGDSKELLRDHLRHESFVSLLRPVLIKVWMFDVVISLFGVARGYDFTDKSELLDQIKKQGLGIEGEVEYCYGGHERGINVLLSVRKSSNEV